MGGISNPQPIEQSQPSGDSDVVYIGHRHQGHAIIEKQPDQGQLTSERALGLANHSPSGSSWRYADNRSVQLALALLLDYTDDEDVALEEYMEFEVKITSQPECTGPDDCWRLIGHEVGTTLREAVGEPVVPSVN